MPSTKDYTIGETFHGMFVGAPGSGKTIAEASFHTAGPMYIFDLDGRIAPIKKMFPDADIEYDTFDPFEYERFTEKLEWMMELKNDPKYDTFPYKTVAVDSLTSLARMAILYSLGFKGKGKGKIKGELQLPDVEEYSAEAHALFRAISILRTFPCNFILCAHFTNLAWKDPVSKEDHVVRQVMTGGKKIGAEVPSWFDETYFFESKSDISDVVSYKAYTIPKHQMTFKTALHLPAVIDFTNKNFYEELMRLTKQGGESNALKPTNKL
jgi:hypothetical protein